MHVANFFTCTFIRLITKRKQSQTSVITEKKNLWKSKMKLIQNNQRSRGSEVETNNFSIIPLINWQRMRAERGV